MAWLFRPEQLSLPIVQNRVVNADPAGGRGKCAEVQSPACCLGGFVKSSGRAGRDIWNAMDEMSKAPPETRTVPEAFTAALGRGDGGARVMDLVDGDRL